MFIVTVNEDRCKGCGLCVSVCPKAVLALDNAKLTQKGYHPASVAAQENCIGCKSCAVMCPDCAIRIEKTERSE